MPRIRVPTAVVVTLLGAALTAWFLPALTRQWDDRQKARELKGDLVTQMSRATVNSVLDGYYAFRKPTRAESARDRWRLTSLLTEAQLRTYLPAKDADAWKAYRNSVFNFIELARYEGLMVKQYRIGAPCARPPKRKGGACSETMDISRLDASVIRSLFRQIGLPASPRRSNYFTRQELEVRSLIHDNRLGRDITLSEIAQDLIEMEQSMADDVLAAHPAGFSTSRSDLLHDPLP
jgi:hypothetical protein